MTSARSARVISSWLSCTGAGRNPPSVPICQNGSAALAGLRARALETDLQDQEARVAAVEEAEAVAARLDLEGGPGAAVDDGRVPEELRVPYGRDIAAVCTDVRPRKAVEELAAGRVKERAVAVKGAVLYRDRDLVVFPAGWV